MSVRVPHHQSEQEMRSELPTVQTKTVNGRAPALGHVAGLLSRIVLRCKVVAESLARVARDLAPGFEYFRYARLNENVITSIFAEMLRPEGSHGQGELFLRLFLEVPGLADQSPQKVVLIETERQANDQRRIDIFLRIDNYIIAIENKPWGSDQDNQIHDYAAFAKSQASAGGDWRMVYLSNRAPKGKGLRSEDRSNMLERGRSYRDRFPENRSLGRVLCKGELGLRATHVVAMSRQSSLIR